jgi:hypothetical protein
MIGKLVKSEIAQGELSKSAAEPLHFDSSTTRFIKSGSMCSLHCHGGSYKLLREYPPSPQLVSLPSPSPNGEGFYLVLYP